MNECTHCHTPRKRGNAFVLIGPNGDLACDLLWTSHEGDEIFCSPACLLAFVEPRIETVQLAFTEEFCRVCGKDVPRGVAYSAPYESHLDTIGAGMAHADCFLETLRQDVVEFAKMGLQPWCRTGRETPEYDAPRPRRTIEEDLAQIEAEHGSNPQAVITHSILRLLFG